MKININSPLLIKALAAFEVLMAFFYLGAGIYILAMKIPDDPWLGKLMGALFVFYGAFRLFRIYQKHKNENK